MTRRKKFIYNGILLTIVGLAIRSVSMLFNSYITRTVGTEGIGLFTLIMTVYSFAITFATSGISLTVTRLVAAAIGEGDVGRVRKIMRHAVVYALIFSVFSGLVLFLFAEYFGASVLGDGRTVLPLRALSVSLTPIALTSVFGGYFVGVKRVAKNAVVQVLTQVFKISITVFLVLKFAKHGVEYATLALCISITLTELCAFFVSLIQYIYDKKEEKRENGVPSRFSDITSMALPLALSAYIRSALLTLEHILIPKRLRDRGDSLTEALSSYGILHGMTLPMLIYPMSPLTSFSGLLVPEFAESMASSDEGRMSRMASEALNTTLLYSVCAAVLLYIFSEELGFVIYGSYDAGRYIALMAPVVPIMYLDHVTDSMLKGIGEHVYSMWVNISDSLLSVILIWFLIPAMGIGGYAVVIVVMEGYNFILSFLRLKRKIKFKIDLISFFAIPLAFSTASAYLCQKLFIMGGEGASGLWLVLKLVFASSIIVASFLIRKQIKFPTLWHKTLKNKH